MKLSTALHKTIFYLILATFALIPLYFLPITAEFYDFNKNILLILLALTLLILWTTSFVVDRQVRITRSPLGLPVLALVLSWLLSTFLVTPNRFDAFFEPGQTGTVVAIAVIFLVAINSIRTRNQLDQLIATLLGTSTLLAAISVIWGTGIMDKVLPLLYMRSNVWTPTGNPLVTLSVVASLIPFTIVLIAREKTASTKTLLMSVSLFISVVAVGIISYRLFRTGSTSRPVFLPQSTSWAIALESLKISPLLGTGPSTYVTSFSRFRPISFNLSPNWNIRFSSSSNYYLQILSTVGVFGLLAYLFLASRVFRLFSKSFQLSSESHLHTVAFASALSAGIIFVAQIFLPTSLVWLLVLFVLLTILVSAFKLIGSNLVHEANIDLVAASDSGLRSPILPWVALFLAVVIAAPGYYYTGRAFLAEKLYKTALDAVAANDGRKTYDTLIQTISMNPYRDVYRVAYSQTNLMLANSIAAKPSITDDDRNTITQLIQQAIREGKNAVALNPTKVSNVENLASIYRNLLNFAEGADVWTLASYREAINLDPANPNLRIALGGLYYAAQNYDEAIRHFLLAKDLKPDLANAYYNLAAAYREKGDATQAIAALQAVLNTIDKTSADYTKALGELEDLKRQAGQSAAATPVAPAETTLETPQPLPSPRLNPPIQLPEDAGPENSATPEPTAAPSPTP